MLARLCPLARLWLQVAVGYGDTSLLPSGFPLDNIEDIILKQSPRGRVWCSAKHVGAKLIDVRSMCFAALLPPEMDKHLYCTGKRGCRHALQGGYSVVHSFTKALPEAELVSKRQRDEYADYGRGRGGGRGKRRADTSADWYGKGAWSAKGSWGGKGDWEPKQEYPAKGQWGSKGESWGGKGAQWGGKGDQWGAKGAWGAKGEWGAGEKGKGKGSSKGSGSWDSWAH